MNNSQKRILIAEDETTLNEMMVIVLEEEEYQVDSADNGEEAWELLSKNKYDLLATDLYMPIMNGIELIKKCQKSYPETKILLLCGGGKELQATHGNPNIKFNEEPIKIDMFLKKPYELTSLLSEVKDLVT